MNKNIFLWFIGILILISCVGTELNGQWVPMPGKIENLANYMNYHHANPEENLIYYLNEILLMEEKPDLSDYLGSPSLKMAYLRTAQGMMKYWKAKQKTERLVMKELFASRITHICYVHNRIKEKIAHINRLQMGVTGDTKEKGEKEQVKVPSDHVSLELNSAGAILMAREVLQLTGLNLGIGPDNKYRVTEYEENANEQINHYYRISGIDPLELQEQLNKTNRFDFTVKECRVKLPRSLDFFRDVTENYHMTIDDLAAAIIGNTKMQLLIGILYRLSDREIDFISRSMQGRNAWIRIYKSRRLLNGMFLLSHALRVKDNRIQLPGGPGAAGFWRAMSEGDPKIAPIDFLEKLCFRHEGKLAWFYVFGSFLPEESQKILFRDFDCKSFGKIYDRIRLAKMEKILEKPKENQLPALRSFGFFQLMYALQVKNGDIEFPGGVEAWAEAVGAKEHTLQSLLEHLAGRSAKDNGLKPFISVYSKFFDRPELINEAVIRSLYKNYRDYNVMVDFIETIPIKKPETALNMMAWAERLGKMRLSRKTKIARIAVAQSLAALVAEMARNKRGYTAADTDYDGLMAAMMEIPLTADGADIYDGVFRFLENNLDISLDPDKADKSFMDFLVTGVRDRLVTVRHQDYILKSPTMVKKEISDILEKQQVTPFAVLVRINRLLDRFRRNRYHDAAGTRLLEAFDELRLPFNTGKVVPEVGQLLYEYSWSWLLKQLDRLKEKKQAQGSQKEVDGIIAKIKESCLLYELKNYLVACVYAVNTEDSSLRIFLNPNFTRLHFFDSARLKYVQDRTPWNHSRSYRRLGRIPLYHMEGGLSRLNIVLASPIGECVMKKSIDYYPTQMAPLIYNHMDLYPDPDLDNAQEYCSLLVTFGNELLEKAEKNPELKTAVTDQLARLTAGAHYRNVVGRLDGCGTLPANVPDTPDTSDTQDTKTAQKMGKMDYGLFTNETLKLAEAFVKEKRFLDECSHKERLNALTGTFVREKTERQMHRLGSIYYHTFGRLRPYRFPMFPQPLSHLFAEKWVGGEMIDELKIKVAHVSHEKGFPAHLLGHLVYRFLRMAHGFFLPGFLNDYHKTYFLYNIYNYLQLNHVYKTLKREGALIIK